VRDTYAPFALREARSPTVNVEFSLNVGGGSKERGERIVERTAGCAPLFASCGISCLIRNIINDSNFILIIENLANKNLSIISMIKRMKIPFMEFSVVEHRLKCKMGLKHLYKDNQSLS